MHHKICSTTLIFSGFVLLLIGASQFLLNSSPAEAQCGSQESSCKSCHEGQSQDPVNSDGTGWHESHAFGDFCYLCHAGNQQTMEQEAAHTGMVPPLSDVEASCKLCHSDDLTERAQVYASVLGVDLNSGGGTSDQGTSPTESDNTTDGTGNTTNTSISIPANNRLVVDDPNAVDYEERYNEIVLGKHPTNWGNIILATLIGLLVVGGGGFVIVHEIQMSTSLGETKKAEGEYPADVVDMLPNLTELKPQTRKALRKILANPQKTEKVLGLIDAVVSEPQTEESKNEINH
ncbi:MAG: hypothetical protein HY862_14325 [Chloroflexi bacterium]|nr:hypothetical protein [Chloroflexota bacterium]